MLKNQVCILDYELMSPIAIGVENVVDNIRSNFTAEDYITRIDVSGLPFRRAAEIKEDLSGYLENESDIIKGLCASDRKFELLAACYGIAANRLEKFIKLFDKNRTGVILGIGADAMSFEIYEDQMVEYFLKGYNPVNELLTDINRNRAKINLINNPYDMYAVYLASKFNAAAFQKSVLTACVSSTQAIALAYDSIMRDETDVVIAGGTDSLINLLAMISFGKLGVINESEEMCCKPFDINRSGTLAGESAGFVILASDKFAMKNKIKPVAKILGYGNTLDGYKITAPDPKGDSMTAAISDALQNAGLKPEMIDYINAHGTGTRNNDHLELTCFERALGKHGKKIPISSTKDRHGHAIAAAGIQELCVLLESMKHKIIPGNLHMNTPCDDSFNLVTENYSSDIKYALSSNFAFGGINTVLAVKNEMV